MPAGEAGVPVITGPCLTDRSKPELVGRPWTTRPCSTGRGEDRHLHRPPGNAHPAPPPLCVLAVRGAWTEEALAAITRAPPRLRASPKRVGTLTPGKDADVVVTSGHPFDWNGSIRAVFLNGRRVK